MPHDDSGSAPKRQPIDLSRGARGFRGVSLSRSWRGYAPADVDRFLEQAAIDYESALRELERLEAQQAALGAQISEHRQRERELAATLSAAKEAADAIRHRAEAQARRIDQEADARAADVVKPALVAQDSIRRQIEALVDNRRKIEETLARSIASLREMRSSTRHEAPGASMSPLDDACGANPEAGPPADDRSRAVASIAQKPSIDLPGDLPGDLPAAEDAFAPISAPAALAAPLTQRKPSTVRFARVAVPLAAAAAVTSAVLVYQFRDRSPAASQPSPATASPAEQPPPSAEALRAQAEARAQVDASEGRPSQPSPSASAVPPRAARADTRRLIITARRDCWLRAIADGRNVREGLVLAGAEIVLEFRDAASVRAGDAGAVSMTLDGQPLGPLGGNGQVVTKRFAGR
jgi:cell division septum initiation protein DivIVA